MMLAPVRALAVLLFLGAGSALAQDAGTQNRAASTVDTTPPGTLERVTLPPLANPDAPNIPAKELFARKLTPLAGPARAIGGYAKGCMAGGEELPITGPTWQVMRLSRNRNWGNPELIDFIKRFGANAKKAGWNGLLIGDMAQPRGGPMYTGHASHQIGLDADIWLTPMPKRELTREEREEMSATMVVAADRKDVDPKVWTHGHMEVIKAAAEDPVVERIFVNAAIKKALDLEPVLPNNENDSVEIPAGFDPSAIRLTGNVAGQPPFRGALIHPGWRVKQMRLPAPPEGADDLVLAAAEVEIP